VTVRVDQGDSTILATMPLRTTSILKMMIPYTIVYDAAMMGNRRGVQSPRERAGIGVGVAVAAIAVFVGAGMMLWCCRVKSKKSKTIHQDGEAESANFQEREGSLNKEGRAIHHLEAPNSQIHELRVHATNPPSELEAVHQMSVEMSAGSDNNESEFRP
jgi:hypothetical protein